MIQLGQPRGAPSRVETLREIAKSVKYEIGPQIPGDAKSRIRLSPGTEVPYRRQIFDTYIFSIYFVNQAILSNFRFFCQKIWLCPRCFNFRRFHSMKSKGETLGKSCLELPETRKNIKLFACLWPVLVQWKSLALREPPSWSRLTP